MFQIIKQSAHGAKFTNIFWTFFQVGASFGFGQDHELIPTYDWYSVRTKGFDTFF